MAASESVHHLPVTELAIERVERYESEYIVTYSILLIFSHVSLQIYFPITLILHYSLTESVLLF